MGVSRSKRRTAPGQLEQVPRPKATFPATGLRDAGAFALLFCATLAAYLPVLHGSLLWDDNMHVTRPDLRSLHGHSAAIVVMRDHRETTLNVKLDDDDRARNPSSIETACLAGRLMV